MTKFRFDPYPTLQHMRVYAPIAYVPALDAILISKSGNIFKLEKITDVFSSVQPEGLMTKLMGQNMMRKDGYAHLKEHKAIFPTVSPKTVQNVWETKFKASTKRILDDLIDLNCADLVKDFAMPVSAEALKVLTGLTNMSWQEMDRVSQGMIEGYANYNGSLQMEAFCHNCTSSIDTHIIEILRNGLDTNDMSLVAVQKRAGLSDKQLRANIKLVISGGRNEPQDAIAGIIWAVLQNTSTLEDLKTGN